MKKVTLLSVFYFCTLFFLIMLYAKDSLAYSTDIIPADRRIDWTYTGIPGGIPDRTNVCQTLYASTFGNGTTDAASAINNALSNCTTDDQVVYLSAGTYIIKSPIRLLSHHILRGAGPGKTVIKYTGSVIDSMILASTTHNYYIDLFGDNTSNPPIVPVIHTITNTVKGSPYITLDSISGLTVGDNLLINQLNDNTLVTKYGTNWPGTGCNFCGIPPGDRLIGQIVEITNINGNVVTINIPLNWTYTSSLSPRAYRLRKDNAVRYAGIEDLTLTQDAPLARNTISFTGTQNSWVKNVEIANVYEVGIDIRYALQCDFSDNYIHTAINGYSVSSAYGLGFTQYSTNNRIVNNIFDSLTGSPTAATSNGNVVAYNLSHNIFFTAAPSPPPAPSPTPYWMIGSPYLNHGAHPYMNLFEGNVAYMADSDFVWGSGSHNTIFRSRSFGWMRDTINQNNAAIRLAARQWYVNALGNVLGTAGKQNKYEATVADYYNSSNNYIWVLGHTDTGYVEDATVAATLIRHGNYDYFNNNVVDWKTTDHTLPASLYLSQKPSWWCQETPWPAIGPDVTGGTEDPAGHTYKIPAQRRFEGLSCTTGANPTLTLPPTQTLTVTASPIVKPGDANNDTKVDGLDFSVWLTHYKPDIAQSGSYTIADFNKDSFVDGIDYSIWLTNYGK